jgi:hypothetical protein
MDIEIAKTLSDFIKQICILDENKTKQILSYSILLEKIISSEKKEPLQSVKESVKAFLNYNKDCILKEPLVLKKYTFTWLSVKSSENGTFKKIQDLDLLSPIAKAKDNELKILHCYMLKLSEIIYQNECVEDVDKYKNLLKKLLIEVPLQMNEPEKEVVEKLFEKMLNIQNEIEGTNNVGSFFSKITQLVSELRKPHLKTKLIFKYLIEKVEELISDKQDDFKTSIQTLIDEIKSCDYNFGALNIIRIVNLLYKINKEINETYPGYLNLMENANILSFIESDKKEEITFNELLELDLNNITEKDIKQVIEKKDE